ncbi:neuraminidase-like domain-containing protein [Neobacillus bataviensis]|uniref:Tc toxin subunit A-related protein n=1 Tax=Neobacillus bataviensis TaxID=220685 RepID=UPI001CBC2C7F|nr:neuraminidase-like domain-containing protein [Neobacillus bataviensis]
MNKLNFKLDKITKTDISNLHAALIKLKLPIAANEMDEKLIGDTTVKAFKELQKQHGLPPTGKLTEETLGVVNRELFDRFHASSKTRAARLHRLLANLGLSVTTEEKNRRIVGESTRQAIKKFQEQAGLAQDGKITEDILDKMQQEEIKRRYSSKTQISKLQYMIQRSLKIASLPDIIAQTELKEKNIGATTTQAIKSLQTKYNLPQTGQLDKATLDRIQSIAASRGVRKPQMGKPQATELAMIKGKLRLNKVSPQVANLQRALAHLGYSISQEEYKAKKFGKTTREAVLAYQQKEVLPETGQVETLTLRSLNTTILTVNPDAALASTMLYKVCGTVRDELMQPKSNMTIKVYEKLLEGESAAPLAVKKNFLNGFFDVAYPPPIDSKTGKVKEPLHLVVKLFNEVNQQVGQPQFLYQVSQTQWVNFNMGGLYKGEPEYTEILKVLLLKLGTKKVTDLSETPVNPQVTQLGKETGLPTDYIMRMILSQLISASTKNSVLTPEVFYSFIRQQVPSTLPDDLLRATNDWKSITVLTESALTGIIFSSESLWEQMLNNAVQQNLVPATLTMSKTQIIQEFRNLKQLYTLEKPILIGDGNLKSLLAESAISLVNYNLVADLFIKHNGFNEKFWAALQTSAIGVNVAKGFEVIVNLGNISKNHIPTVRFLKSKIASQPLIYKSPSSFAKLDQQAWISLINANGKSVPADMPGADADKRVAAYAVVLQSRAEALFPSVALVAAVKRGVKHILQKLDAVAAFIDNHPDFDFKRQNIDKYLLDHPGILLDAKTIEETKLLQRVHKLVPDAITGKAVLEEGLHSSSQIYFTGKKRLTDMLAKQGVEAKQASALYEQSKLRYMQILGYLMNFRSDFHAGSPQAISKQTYTTEEIQETVGDIPDLETLFGSQDFCQCEDCQSLYGPAAYLTDLLRFLKEHDSLITRDGRVLTVKDILFDRRPDLGNIKLNSGNTETPMPYIDLVCEILENYMDPKQTSFAYQTTGDAKESRAFPQYIRPEAYDALAVADYPMDSTFNLWQEEARILLDYLKVPRVQLMEAFLDRSNSSVEMSIAAEYFGLSSYEAKMITLRVDPNQPGAIDVLQKYWGEKGKCWSPATPAFEGINVTLQEVPMSLLLKRLKLSYLELLELLQLKWLGIPQQSMAGICDLAILRVTQLNAELFDRIHRFIRLWRKTGWKMWELDLLIRNEKIGANELNSDTLIHLKQFKQLQEKLALPVEILLTFYGNINAEQRVKPDHPDQKIPPLYHRIFLNKAIINPEDSHFKLNGTLPERIDQLKLIDETLTFEASGDYTPVPTILSALAIKQSDFEILREKTDNHLSMASLSALLRYSYLARSLKLSVKDLWLLMKMTNKLDAGNHPFLSVQTTLDFIKDFEAVKRSGLTLVELDYLLTDNLASAAGLRQETMVKLITNLHNILASHEQTNERLGLDEIKTEQILTFNTDGLEGMTDEQVLSAIKPLQEILKSTDLAAEERDYIIRYNPTEGYEKKALAEHITKLQEGLKDLLDQKSKAIVAHMAAAFGLSDHQAKFLLETLELKDVKETLLKHLTDKSLPQEQLFPIYILMHKIAILVLRMKIDSQDLVYVQSNHSALDVLDLASLPIKEKASIPEFKQWFNLFQLLDFKAVYPEPEEASLLQILDQASDTNTTVADIHQSLNQMMQWNTDDLAELHAAWHLTKEDYRTSEVFARLQRSFDQMKMTGVNSKTMLVWAERDKASAQKQTARQIRLAVKSKYEQEDWLDKITPLQDILREKKRQALVAYHLEKSQRTQTQRITLNGLDIPNPLYWDDSNALFKYFLIDVEMSSCMLTSRIKQAISSIQLFVQRCFLNLENRYVQVSQDEKEDVSSENAWSQWKWMKNFRIWEANRKVFFYPENWLEPELRDDKSPFFEELENEIMQNDITHEHVEEAFFNYLHKVDDVANLEVCALYHEMEELNPHELGYEINIVHVIARTKSFPSVYYYRKYDMNYGAWSAWEKIETDITGNHIVPVIYNRKLHLFWLVFTEKPSKIRKIPPAQPTSGPKDAPEPPKILEVQLAWSVKRETGWTAKKIANRKLIHPWERPYFAYNVKPFYQSSANELWLDIYLSTSKEFNNRQFYDPYLDQFAELTGNRFHETYLPWHSASFVFDGDVKEVKLKPLNGKYHLSGPGRNVNDAVATNSYVYVNENFGEDGANITMLLDNEVRERLALPNGMHYHNTRLTNNRQEAINDHELRVLENNKTTTLLTGALPPFELVITQQDGQFNTLMNDHPFVYQDKERAFFIKPEWQRIINDKGSTYMSMEYRALPFYHPYTALFIRELNRGGLDGLLKRKIQTEPKAFLPRGVNPFSFDRYHRTSVVEPDETVQSEMVDFSFGGAYAIYNWEIFFHAPMMIACKLSQNQRFEEAMRWFHYIFDPTNIESEPSPQRYWVTKPFYQYNEADYRKQRIEQILSQLDIEENKGQLKAWRNHPFKPHLIARYRPVAYQRHVVMKYLDNLIAWGDQLFRQDTVESINEASLLYMLAYELLGPRPEQVPNVKHQDMSFNELESGLDELGNARFDVIIEDYLPPLDTVPAIDNSETLPAITTFYFCIPNNDMLLGYWDTVEDRLFKIRHCMNIDGAVRQLPLFEPPIDPPVLVKAASAGMDLSSVLADVRVATPHYRFRVVVQKAIEFCNEVRTLGEKLLSALEKKDAEGLALLRSQHEIQLLEAVKEIKQKQVDEALEAWGSLNKAYAMAQEKKSYYDDKEFMNVLETISAVLFGGSIFISGLLTYNELMASVFHLLPSFNIGISGFGGTPHTTVQWGSENIARSMQSVNSAIQHVGSLLSQSSSLIGTMAGYERRKEEWDFQARLAGIEMEQLQFSINAAQIRKEIAEKEVEHHDQQIENAKTTDEYMSYKYTNEKLYSWMITQISSVYFQAYQLAFDMAKKAEKCYQYELGIQESSYIQFGYWDSLKKGLLAGDKLMHDLRRLETAYLDENKRELEITKHISLAQVDPLSLVKLKENGTCTISLPEWLFNMDYPGHYMRRIKSISVSIPCVAGPYTSVNCTLSLIKNEVRLNAALPGDQYQKGEEDNRFKTQWGRISSIATSHAQNDSGLFELNFNDDRYLPFEGAGVISQWEINMPKENNYFDFATISDLVLHVRYTARDGGSELAKKGNEALQSILPTSSMRLFSLKRDFSSEWYRFFHVTGGEDQELVIQLKPEHYPFYLRGKINTLKLNKLELLVDSNTTAHYESMMKVTNTAYEAEPTGFSPHADINSTLYALRDYKDSATKPQALGELRMKMRVLDTDYKSLKQDDINDVYLLCQVSL